MTDTIRIGLDTSKSLFQLHGVNAAEQSVLRQRLGRREMIKFFEQLPPVVVALDACGASHHWARLLSSFGHEVKLIARQLAKPYVKRGKNDAADTEALGEAASRPTMRFVPAKTAEQQAALMPVGMLHQRSGTLAEHEQIAAMGIAIEALLDQQGQSLHPLPHIGVPHRDPYPRARRDHRNAFSGEATSAGDAQAKMLIRLPRAGSMTIAGCPPACGPGASSIITAAAKPGGLACRVEAAPMEPNVQAAARFAGGQWCIVGRSRHGGFRKTVKYTSNMPVRRLEDKRGHHQMQANDKYGRFGKHADR